MFGVVREFQAPLTVTHAVRGRFGASPTSLGVVFARKNSLDIYVVRANKDLARLELLQSTPLGANVISMGVLKRSGAGADHLCIGFNRMRVAIMAWDNDARSWTTDQLLDLGSLLGSKLCSPSSLARSLDPEDYGRPLLRGSVGDHGQPLIRTDPSGRCIAVLAKAQNAMYVVPVRVDDDASKADLKLVNPDDVFLIDLPIDYEATNIKDFAFLEGAFEPNIVILHEPKRTWSGRAAIQRNTCQLLNLLLDMRSKRHTKTWAMDSLPYDSERVEAVPESAGGGALLLSASVLMQVRHGACVAGLSLNCFGDAYSTELKGKYDTITASDTLVECDAAHCRFLDFEERTTESSSSGMQCIALLSLKGGELYFLSVAVGSRNAITMKRAGSTVIASEIVPINERFFVLASRLSDSLLVEYQKIDGPEEVHMPEQNTPASRLNTFDSKSMQSKRKKRKRTAEEDAEYEMIYGVKPPQDSSDEESSDEQAGKKFALELQDKDEGTRGVYDDDDELGEVFNSAAESEAVRIKGDNARSWALKVKDTLTCFGPGADLAIGPSPEDVTSTKLDMIIAGGYAKNGCLAVVHQSVRPTHRTEFELSGCEGVWTLLDPGVTKKEILERRERNEAANRRNAARRARNTKRYAARRRFVEDAIVELRKEREAQTVIDRNDADNGSLGDASGKTVANGDHLEVNGDVDDDSESVLSDTPRDDVAAKSKPDGTDAVTASGGEDVSGPDTKRRKAANGKVADGKHTVDVRESPIEEDILLQFEEQAESAFPVELEEQLEEGIVEESSLHSYMLLSTSTSTTALKTGVEIVELVGDSADFVIKEKTIAAGNVFGSEAIVQVVPSGVCVLKEGKKQCEYNMSDPAQIIAHAQVSDPLVLLQTSDNRVIVLEVAANVVDVTDDAGGGEVDSIPGQDELFDEYGMSLPGTEASVDSKRDPVKELSSNPKATEVKPRLTTFSDFAINVRFTTSSSTTDDRIISSFLYKGPLADEIAEDGILQPETTERLQSQQDNSEIRDNGEDVVRESNGIEEKDKNEGVGAKGERIDDEDDMMLYGAGDLKEESKAEGRGNAITKPDGSTDGNRFNCTNGVANQNLGRKQPSPKVSERGVVALPLSSEINREHGHLLVLSKGSGAIQIISAATQWSTILENSAFFAGPTLVKDAPQHMDDKQSKPGSFASSDLVVDNLAMMELPGSALLPGLSTPILVAISRCGLPLIYRVFMASSTGSISAARSRLSLHRIVFRDRTADILVRSMKSSCFPLDPDNTTDTKHKNRRTPLAQFRNIAGRGGIFIGGSNPFILFAERGYPRIHPFSHSSTESEPLAQEGNDSREAVMSFTEFHNVKCPRGFVSVAQDGIVRIGELPPPSVMNFDAPTPMKKVALRCTPHKVAYHAGSATYGVLASMPTLTTREERLARILQSLEKHDKRHYQHTAAQAEAETGGEGGNRVPPLFEELHELRVYRPDTWELIKSHKLQKGEVGLAIANMKVDVYKQRAVSAVVCNANKNVESGGETPFAASLKMRPKDMLVVGTGHLNGEDASSRGRLLLFEISRQQAFTEPGEGFTAFQLQLIAEKELFSPVTAVASMEGYVIAGVGPQISVYKLVGDEIVHLSFAFGQLYCTSIASLKQYVVAADMCKSVSFMYFRDRNNSVNFLGKDYEHVTSYATEFLLENEDMSIVVSDGKGNIQLMSYAHASVPESRGGKRLLINGGTQLGSRINKFVRVRAPDSWQDVQSGQVSRAGSHPLLFATLDGGIGALVAVPEVEFRKLEKLHDQLLSHPGVSRQAGVNPAEQTAFTPEASSTVLLAQRLLDSRVVFDLFSVTILEQEMIARESNTNLYGLANTVSCLDSLLSRF